jgi:hypothetical protein
MVHVFGPVATLWALAGRARLRATLDVAPDFGPVRSLAFEEWARERGAEGVKSSLSSDGYYHSWGVSSGLEASLSIAPIHFELGGRAGWYESIDGIDRSQEQVTHDVHASDSIVELRGSIGYEPLTSPWTLRLDWAHFARSSWMAPFHVTRWDDRAGGSVGLRF